MNKLKMMREAKGLSQSQFAKLSKISVRTLQHYEQGTRSINGIAGITLYHMAKALECEIVDILELEPEEEEEERQKKLNYLLMGN